ncbi:hypothetical protein K435DRAFT_806813 [Dendrothele bispora CBS 962.96]|uniref:Uncharacterized protein n=1 Tax=Dendrothele bispora (strain CBS 962.96) TaxID=1314807 RepID=A0A4S8L6M9_DENBC|nr:hypothetical protein K435DRAFT_806813 [Dendrothele bispora CBS 962.96]
METTRGFNLFPTTSEAGLNRCCARSTRCSMLDKAELGKEGSSVGSREGYNKKLRGELREENEKLGWMLRRRFGAGERELGNVRKEEVKGFGVKEEQAVEAGTVLEVAIAVNGLKNRRDDGEEESTCVDLVRRDCWLATWELLHTAAQACEDELAASNAVKLSLTGWLHRSNDENEHYTLRSYDASGRLVGSMHVDARGKECNWFGKREKSRRNRRTSPTSIGFESHRHAYVGEAFASRTCIPLRFD